MKNAKDFWDGAAEKYAKSPVANEAAYKETLDRVRTYLKADDHALELGCGTGSTALLLSGDIGHITASDISPNMIEIARAKARDQGVENLTFVVAGIQDEALEPSEEEGPYDVVMAFNLFHLVEDVAAAYSQVHKLLKPGGMFLSKSVCELDGNTSFKFRLMMLAVPVLQMLGKAPFVRFRSIEEHEQNIRDAGFEILETGNYPASPPNRFVVARRL